MTAPNEFRYPLKGPMVESKGLRVNPDASHPGDHGTDLVRESFSSFTKKAEPRAEAECKVLIGIPCNWDVAPTPFMFSVMNLVRPASTAFLSVRAPTIDMMRNILAESAVNQGYTHLLMLDADMVYPPDTLVKLLRSDTPIVSGFSCRRQHPHLPVFLHATDDPWIHRCGWNMVPKALGMFPVGAVGGAALLIQTSVFKKLEKPWFSFEAESGNEKVGEDVYFSVKARKAGFQPYVRTDVMCGHILQLSATPTFDKIQQSWTIQYSPMQSY